MDRNQDEYEDSVPSLIPQPLQSISEDQYNSSSDQDQEIGYLNSSGEQFKISTQYAPGYGNTSLPSALSNKSSGLSLN